MRDVKGWRCGHVQGFTLIEVLVSIFVLSLGVIGVAGMQLSALRASQQSAFQTVALQLAAEMADGMRANVGQMILADAANPFLQIDYRAGPAQASPGARCDATDCTPAELAAFDIHNFLSGVREALPGGRARVCRDAVPWDDAAKALAWACRGGDGAPIVIKLGWQAKNPYGSVTGPAGAIDGEAPPAVALTVLTYLP
jgi:type IV pilus assembly protein PilV